jgi:hypothetical protein
MSDLGWELGTEHQQTLVTGIVCLGIDQLIVNKGTLH